MQNVTRIALDLAKSVFEIAVSDRPARVMRRERLPRARFLSSFAKQPRARVVMEACGSAHYRGRRIEQLSSPIGFAAGLDSPPQPTSTTRPRSRWQTRSQGLSGLSGPARGPYQPVAADLPAAELALLHSWSPDRP
jgi:hypothetical protein